MELASKDQSIKSKSPTDSILDETDSSSKSTESSTLSLLFDQQKSIEYFSLTSYSWCEEEWKVKIYLDFLGASSITDENIWLVRASLLFLESSLTSVLSSFLSHVPCDRDATSTNWI